MNTEHAELLHINGCDLWGLISRVTDVDTITFGADRGTGRSRSVVRSSVYIALDCSWSNCGFVPTGSWITIGNSTLRGTDVVPMALAKLALRGLNIRQPEQWSTWWRQRGCKCHRCVEDGWWAAWGLIAYAIRNAPQLRAYERLRAERFRGGGTAWG